MKRESVKIFIEEIYSRPPEKKFEKKLVYNHTDGIWSTDLADFSDYRTSNKKG